MREPFDPHRIVDETASDPLDAGLAAAFGPDSGPPLPATGSIVRALGAPVVRLREPDTEPLDRGERPGSPEVPAWLDSAGRLQLHGEIGRGGMGAVMKVRDTGLGRDIAVKVLLEAHAGRTELVARFVEEAQVAGQLQHPGVVPVYDLGLLPDRRPYFTMKLVKGRTLARLLAERADVAQDRPRFLGIFLQVCQAVAYAHARGVIHRDLKPSNVMVGNFGEVQLMDWGLAKVLEEGGVPGTGSPPPQDISFIQTARGGADTQAGTVLGTPPYMAPEQALGEVERLDQRADVFELGAILCEVLTGRPPYAGEDMEAVRRRAARADLADACARLDGCGADPELVALAKRCLAAEPSDRPRDGGALAAELTAYLEGVEVRLRQAQLEQAEAEGRAAESRATAAAEQRSRRLTVGLAASVLALVLAGGGVWVLNERARDARKARQARTGQELNEALGRFAVLRDAARAAWARDGAKWGEAEAALEQAESVLAAAEADAALREQVEGARRDFDRDAAEAARDRAMLARLEELQLELYFSTTSAASTAPPATGLQKLQLDLYFSTTPSHRSVWGKANTGYAAAFRDYGINVPALAAEEAASRVAARRVRKELAAALDWWAEARHKANPGDEVAPATLHLRSVARLADPEPWRERLHAAQRKGDLAALRTMAETADVRKVPRSVLLVLADVLGYYGRHGSKADVERGVALLRRACETYPQDYLLASQLAFFMVLFDPPRWDEHVRYHSVAVALRPDIALLHWRLGNALGARSAYDEALAHIRRGLELSPGSALGHATLAVLYQKQYKLDEAVAEYERAVELEPSEPNYLNGLGAFYLMQKRHDRAMELFRKAIALDPYHPEANANLGVRLVDDQNKLKEAAACFRAAITGNPRLAPVYDNLAYVLEKQGWPEQAAAVYRDGLRRVPHDLRLLIGYGDLLRRMKKDGDAMLQYEELIWRHPHTDWGYFNKALILIHRNDRRAAVPLLRRCLQINDTQPATHFHLGMSLYLLGDRDGGIFYLRTAHDLDPKYVQTLSLKANATELLALAAMHQRYKRHYAAARFFTDVFVLEPKRADDLEALHRYHAACAAALAAAGKGEDAGKLDDKEWIRLRKQALDWLRADLEAYTRLAEKADAREAVRQRLTYWLKDTDLASVRDEKALAALPEAQRNEWQKLWADVAALLKQTSGKP